jgi:integrase
VLSGVSPAREGSPHLRNKSFAKAADAKAFAAKMASGSRGAGLAIWQYLTRWLATLRDRGEHSATTIEGYERCVVLAAPWIGDTPLSKLSALDLDTAYTHLLKQGGRGGRSLSPRTVINVHRCLHGALEQARKWKLIAENPARDARAPPAPRSQTRSFTTDEVKRLLEAASANPMTYVMVSTLLTCGLRRSELLGLAFDAIDLERAALEVRRTVVAVGNRPVLREQTKTAASQRTMRIPTTLVTLLRAQRVRIQEQMLKWGTEYQRDPLLVFPGLAGVPMTPNVLSIRLRKLMRRAGITGVQPCHGWRHTAATLLIDAGTNIKAMQARLGHTTPAITMSLYVHPVKSAMPRPPTTLGACSSAHPSAKTRAADQSTNKRRRGNIGATFYGCKTAGNAGSLNAQR